MAFQQPQRPQASRNAYTSSAAPLVNQPEAYDLSPQQTREWIIFSPNSPAVTDNNTISTARTPRTAGRSRLSELGSLDTDAASIAQAEDGAQEEDLETEDMDSLDDGLHAFHAPIISRVASRPIERSSDTMLPAHDGLGMFTVSSTDIQQQFWQHERYNPQRRRHSIRRSSFQRRFEALEEEQVQSAEDEKLQRIEKWRLDQSRAILEEIERETRRKRRKEELTASVAHMETSNPIEEAVAGPSVGPQLPEPPTSIDSESFWTRITRRVICDLMGFDDATLSIIIGEAFVDEDGQIPSQTEMIREAERIAADDTRLARLGDTWQDRLLARIAKELGVLVNRLTEQPGAFSTYLTTHDPPLYSGLVERPCQSVIVVPTPIGRASMPANALSTTEIHFNPTLAHQDHTRRSVASGDASLWGIEEEGEDQQTPAPHAKPPQQHNESAYWEQDLDIKVLFRYIRNRLSSSRRLSQVQQPPEPAGRNTIVSAGGARNEPDSLRRAALIRRHHPLVSKNIASWEESEHVRRSARSGGATLTPPVLGRRHSGREDSAASCASQSTKRSKTGRSGSSRNYWDVGTGSLGSGGWNTGWGEV